MRIFVLTLSLLSVLYSCTKDPAKPNTPTQSLDYTPVPSPSPINTVVSVRLVTQPFPIYVSTDANNYNYLSNYHLFLSPTIAADKYLTTLMAKPQLTIDYHGYDTYKSFAIISPIKNYINLKLLNPITIGSFLYDYGSGNFLLPGNGQITLPPYSFGNHSGTVTFTIKADYLHPSINDYAVSIPCYPMSDENQKRYFLNSYGIYLIQAEASDNSSYNIDINPSANVKIILPIQPGQLSNAPDSIPTWNLNSHHLWQRNGYAHKVNNSYEKIIDHKGFWNFAQPLDGIYLTLHLKTQSDFPVPNTKFTLKTGTDEIAEGRTDAEGNALTFVPANKPLTIYITNDHTTGISNDPYQYSIGAISSTSDKTVTIPLRYDIMTLEGSVYNCDGSNFTNGTAIFSLDDDYVIPIVNGHFKTSAWIFYHQIHNLAIRDNSGNTLVNYNIGVGGYTTSEDSSQENKMNFYTCLNSSKLYCNYRIDSTEYSISGDVSSLSPILTATSNQITMYQNGTGVSFTMNDFNSTGFSLSSILRVNQTDYSPIVNNSNSKYYITRADAVGGFVEGWFMIHYKDNNNMTHKISGDFRVKRTG